MAGMRARAVLAIVVLFSLNLATAQVAGSHTSLNRWCGKPYQTGSPNYDPGGQTRPPPTSSCRQLYLQAQPRYNIYVDSEKAASFLVSAGISRMYGEKYEPTCAADERFHVTITTKAGIVLVKSAPISADDMQVEIKFKTKVLQARMKPYAIVVKAVSNSGTYTFTTTTELFFLPDKTTGSVTKVDNLYGGLLFKNPASNQQWRPVFGVSYYTSYGGFLALNTSATQMFLDAGFSTVHPISPYNQPSNPPYLPLSLDQVWDEADRLDVLWIYDMRWSFQNTTQMSIEVSAHKDRDSLLMWYTADEPDGWEYALNITKVAYDVIRAIDLYHPVSLVLNCADFYFKQYTSGADIIMEDAYPIGINATFSTAWGIPCNATYGDCGCDDCVGAIQDVSDRLDAFAAYQKDLGQLPKPVYGVPQAFMDPEYWSRIPTQTEVWAMNGLAINHGAMSLYSWAYPAEDSLVSAHGAYAKTVTVSPVLDFLVGANPVSISVPEYPKLDVAYWCVGRQTLVSFVNGYNNTVDGTVDITLPFKASGVVSQPFGALDWRLVGDVLAVGGVGAFVHSMVILDT